MKCISLETKKWQLQGWRPFYWKARKSMETGGIFSPEFGPYNTTIPGSVQHTLRAAGELPDWNVGRNTLQCEWVEHRHWEFFTELDPKEFSGNETITLCADGLDYSGWILIDTQIVGEFSGSAIRHRFDLSKPFSDGKPHRLSIVFDSPPEDHGQVGFTSKSRYFKPRYSFSWDWCPRFVPIGIWDSLRLECGPQLVNVIALRTETSRDLKTAKILARLDVFAKKSVPVEIVLRSPAGRLVQRKTFRARPGESELSLPVSAPQLWWPNGMGKAAVYEVEIRLLTGNEVICRRKVGFKHVRWLPNPGCPKGARNLLCEVNGKPVFLQGVNWTPIQMDYPSTPDSSYEKLVSLYREMGCNLLRIWGGGYLEKEIFYRLCDEAGILVWQEFPLSSSGIDNDAPSEASAIRDLAEIATDYVRRRQHHPSLLLWCGGNELQTTRTKETPSRPLDESHPALAALKKVVEKEQPGIRFLPTSPSGPTFFAHRPEMGKGIHHHVHGPWDNGTRPENDWIDYWENDDSLMRTETGTSGTAGAEIIRKYAGDEPVWPPEFANPLWRHSASWWLQWNGLREEMKGVPKSKLLSRYTELSQEKQAKFLRIAAAACKKRFPTNSGFFVWMGHDAFPCPANTSIIDFDLKPKAAYFALQQVFLGKEPA